MKYQLPKTLCIPGRRSDGSDSEWFLTDSTGKVQKSIGTGSRCPTMTPDEWARITCEIATLTGGWST